MNTFVTNIRTFVYQVGHFELSYYMELFREAEVTVFLSYVVCVAFFEYFPCDVGCFVDSIVP